VNAFQAVAIILATCAAIGLAAAIPDLIRDRRRRPDPDPEPPQWVNDGAPRVTPDRRHRPRHDWREDCKR